MSTNMRKFRFAVFESVVARAASGGSPSEQSGERWREKARKVEELGYSSLLVPDHFVDQLAPVPAIMAAADATTTLRVGALVLNNDYRHPLVLAKEMATIDVLTGGRLEIGMGAGWLQTDYAASGMTYDRPGVRISRFKEGVAIVKGLLSDGPLDFAGDYYTIANHHGTPRPVQKPHPPILIGGGGKRMLSIAAREADIISVNVNLGQGAVSPEAGRNGGAEATDEKIGWIRQAAGIRFHDIELSATISVGVVTHDPRSVAERIAPGFGMPPEDVLNSPHVLVGTTDQMAEMLQQRRERYGFSYIAFPADRFESYALVVRKLAGT